MAAAGTYAFFDIDGTLVYRDEKRMNGVPSPGVRRALEAYVNAGGTCVLCTGRPIELVVPEVLSLPFAGYITMDGARVDIGDRVVRDVAMPPELMRVVLQEFERLDISAIFESSEANISLDRGDNWFRQVTTVKTAQEVEYLWPSLRFSKIVFHNHELEKYQTSDFMREHFTLLHLGDGMNEVITEGIDKGAGMLAFIDALDVKPTRTYAFGDSENDLPMIAAADVGVVMANALSHVIERGRALGAYITDTVSNDGVVAALEHFNLLKGYAHDA